MLTRATEAPEDPGTRPCSPLRSHFRSFFAHTRQFAFPFTTQIFLASCLIKHADAQTGSKLNVTYAKPPNGVSFVHQGQDINFSGWITLLTLCFAPLIAHIVAGVPPPVYLSAKAPTWHERISHYNPTSIIWRYVAILDRRIRAKQWQAVDMAASNALFWTDDGWDGSESMMIHSRHYCQKQPRSGRTAFFSASTTKTIIIGLQGVQGVFNPIDSLNTQFNFATSLAVDSVFLPLAVIGLLRLPVALWLTDEYSYISYDSDAVHDSKGAVVESIPLSEKQRTLSGTLIKDPTFTPEEYFQSPHTFWAWPPRLILMTFLAFVWAVAIIYMSPLGRGSGNFSATTLITGTFYVVFLGGTILICGAYFFLGRTTSTIIPCIVATWYKVYTILLFVLMLAVVVISALETRKLPCGRYTSYPPSNYIDVRACGGIPISKNAADGLPFGIAMQRSNVTRLTPTQSARISFFEGWCYGSLNGSEAVTINSIGF